MKIEKVNDHQIRCTLTKSDLADRELKITELAYGTEKARSLFHDMMKQASTECGFEAEDIPLMIEAIPMTPDCIVLIITKVEDPEELDTRFSKFSPSIHEKSEEEYLDLMEEITEENSQEGAGEVLDLFKKINKEKIDTISQLQSDLGTDALPYDPTASKSHKLRDKKSDIVPKHPIPAKTFAFKSLDSLILVAKILEHLYSGENTLYKHNLTKEYMLVVNKSNHTPADFNKVCNVLTEYSSRREAKPVSAAFLLEHFEIILKTDALRSLAQL